MGFTLFCKQTYLQLAAIGTLKDDSYYLDKSSILVYYTNNFWTLPDCKHLTNKSRLNYGFCPMYSTKHCGKGENAGH